jgi:uncharacterized protein (DUF58 family)
MAIRTALLNGKRRPRRQGSSPTSRRGDGYEFVELREYVPGDDVRRVDWAASARSGLLQTRIVLEDVALVLAAIVDDSPSMQVGRTRPLLDAAREAAAAWYGIARPDDRRIRIRGSVLAPVVVSTFVVPSEQDFSLRQSLHVARTALRPGSAVLVISDLFDIAQSDDALLYALAQRCDCTALVARDPWYDGLPLSGLVRMSGAEGGTFRGYLGERERKSYADAVRAREASLHARLSSSGWRVGLLHESDGAASLAAAFGLRHDLAS